jgi:hypothetical protein
MRAGSKFDASEGDQGGRAKGPQNHQQHDLDFLFWNIFCVAVKVLERENQLHQH